MARLSKIAVAGFRSFKRTELELRSLNVLIGPNGAGKSNLVSFFTLLHELGAGRLQQYIGKSGRAQSVLHFGPKVTPVLEGRMEMDGERGQSRYEFRLSHAAGDTLTFADETVFFQPAGRGVMGRMPRPTETALGSGHQESLLGEEAARSKPVALAIRSLLEDCRAYHFHDTSSTAPVRQFCYLHDNRRLRPDAGNLAAMLYAYRERAAVAYRRIVATIRKILPEFDDFDLAPSRLNPSDIELAWRQRGYDYVFAPHQFSDGSLRAIAICTLLLQPKADLPGVILLDEPELGLHPQALEIVAGLVRAASVDTQVLVATQSRRFLDFFEPSDVVTVEPRGGASVVRRLETEALTDWLTDYSIGELWERNVLGGSPLP